MMAIALIACTKPQETTQEEQPIGEQMLEMLNDQDLSLLVYHDSTLTTYRRPGLQDLIHLLTEKPEILDGAIVADKIVGRAAASLMIAGKVKEVYTNRVSTPARELLEKEGVHIVATEEVPQILNRDQTGQCPMEASINGAEDIEECVRILQNMVIR